ncbi:MULTISPECIES: hypothetical protein [Pseudomonas]|uniref:hypothetical protein n=1 Tax=Pseudomonas TaxID=286 RepID=UPI00235E1BE6|nr:MULTISPECIES: hypothetical protein [Pseudomonas]WJV25929.1 hypothetical protein PSR66_07840 [Pseudomonas chlororaphis]
MSLKLNERYPGRFNNPSANYPQGSFKNRTTPTAKDGSYLEQDWANDKEGFFQSLLSAAGIVANGTVDTVGNSQFYDSMQQIVKNMIKDSAPITGSVRNARMSISTASGSASLVADEVVVKSALGGHAYLLPSFNKSINLATTGVGGMDTGTAPVSGFVGIYAIFNPTTGVSGLLAVNATTTRLPQIYGGANMPSGHTASALLTVVPTNSSGLISQCVVRDRRVYIAPTVGYATTSIVSTTTVYVGIIPFNAAEVSGMISLSCTAAGQVSLTVAGGTGNTNTGSATSTVTLIANGASSMPFSSVPVVDNASLVVGTSNTSSGTSTCSLIISGYSL